MPRSGPRRVRRYSDEFKRTAVRLSQQPGMQVQTVAAALEIHPFMLSKWRKDARDGVLRGHARTAPAPGPAREFATLQAFERKYAALQEEHDLLKQAMRFSAARRASASPSSTRSRPSTPATASPRSAGATGSARPGSTRGAGGRRARTRSRIGAWPPRSCASSSAIRGATAVRASISSWWLPAGRSVVTVSPASCAPPD